jgi:hypothetical protein
MALPIERWAKQAVLLERNGDFTPAADKRVLADVGELKALEFQTWRQRQRALEDEPTALEGIYAGLNAYPPAADLTTKTAIAGELGLLTAAEIATYMPFAPNGLLAPEAFRVAISGNYTTSTSPGNLTITSRMGTTTSGATLGATGTQALVASITGGGFFMIGDLTIQSVGAPGANSKAAGFFHFMMTALALGAAAQTLTIDTLFGHTQASFDASSAAAATGGGLFFGLTHTTTTPTYIPKQVHWMSWN